MPLCLSASLPPLLVASEGDGRAAGQLAAFQPLARAGTSLAASASPVYTLNHWASVISAGAPPFRADNPEGDEE